MRTVKEYGSWVKDQAQTELIFKDGSEYPVAVVCTVYESNQLGEKRFVEQKTLTIENPDLIKA